MYSFVRQKPSGLQGQDKNAKFLAEHSRSIEFYRYVLSHCLLILIQMQENNRYSTP